MGGLKSNVSQLESEKEDLRKQVADLRAENRRLEGRYAQEVSANNELADRLDGARSILKRQGLDSGLASGASPADDESPPSIPPPRRITPSGRTTPKPRKAPFTEIRARPASDDDRNDLPEPDADLGPQASRSGDSRWNPIARADRDLTPIR
jgi:hypothetical protein